MFSTEVDRSENVRMSCAATIIESPDIKCIKLYSTLSYRFVTLQQLRLMSTFGRPSIVRCAAIARK